MRGSLTSSLGPVCVERVIHESGVSSQYRSWSCECCEGSHPLKLGCPVTSALGPVSVETGVFLKELGVVSHQLWESSGSDKLTNDDLQLFSKTIRGEKLHKSVL